MSDHKGTTTTTATWQDIHSGKRGHQLMTEKLADTIPAIGATENTADYDTVLACAKLFSPFSNWTWFITELDRETGQCFGLVEGFETELGYFDLTELAETTVLGGVPAVERDLYWQPITLGEIKSGSRDGSRRIQETGGGETVTDETETDIAPSEVVNVEEFLFGAAADDAPGGDTAGDVAGQHPAADATEDAGDPEADCDMDTDTAEEPDADADDGEQTVPAETEASAELKVVLTIRAGRAVIGVQRPSADPHIETFDDDDLFGLADQFPAVVARARARWEEEPMHPAYDRPAPPARQRSRNRRQPAATPPADADAGEADQPQVETLRLFQRTRFILDTGERGGTQQQRPPRLLIYEALFAFKGQRPVPRRRHSYRHPPAR